MQMTLTLRSRQCEGEFAASTRANVKEALVETS